MTVHGRVFSRISGFIKSESGAATAFNLLLLLSVVALGGYAVDVSNVVSRRTELQMTADSVAHAALMKREFGTADQAKTAALAVSVANLPIANVGEVIRATDIVFGTWNSTSRTFTPNASSRSAVQVTAREHTDTGNPVATFMLKIVGFMKWDLTAKSTLVTYHPSCLREGFVAQGVVDLQSNNTYVNGFCIHSNTYVKLSSNNTFEPGTVVSMTNLDDLRLPNSGFKTNTGLQDALREGSWNIRIIPRLAQVIASLTDPTSVYFPDFLTSASPIVLTNRNVAQSNLVPGRIHTFSCGNSGAAFTIKLGVKVDKVLIVTDCKIKFEQDVVLTDSVIATTSISDQSMTSGSGLVIGKRDNCAPGGGTQLLTMGSMAFAAAIQVNGSQLIAKKDISFSANADGVQGTSMVAGGTISGTSNMTMGLCGNQDLENVNVEYFTMVE